MIYLDGTYRQHLLEDTDRFTDLAVRAFPEFVGRIECFGADWLGRQFAIDQDCDSAFVQPAVLNTDKCSVNQRPDKWDFVRDFGSNDHQVIVEREACFGKPERPICCRWRPDRSDKLVVGIWI